jgi:hypothetical protein
MSQHHAPRHRHRPRPSRSGRYEVHKARTRNQTVAMVVLAGGLLVLLVMLVRLLGGEGSDTSLELTRPSGFAPRQ